MASSNRHWPSMFKAKSCNTASSTQWPNDDINHSSPSQRPSPYSSSSGCEERTPEPKPRWNPKPEQIRILENIFNSGLVNPPRDEIRRIRAQLQEYGQVGDANVFYWFQNRKSRSKQKQKQLRNSKSSSSSSSSSSTSSSSHVNQSTSAITLTAPSSSSSSSEKSSPIDPKPFPMRTAGVSNLIDVSNSPTASVNQMSYFQTSGTSTGEFNPHDQFYFPVQQAGINNNTSVFSPHQGYCFSELANVVQFPSGGTEQTCSGLLMNEMMQNHGVASSRMELEQSRKFLQEQLQLYTTTTTPSTTIIPTDAATTTSSIPSSVAAPISITSPTASTTINQIQGVDDLDAMGPVSAAKSTVFINDMAIEISVGPLNVRQTFGDDVVLIYPSGEPVLTNEWGFTLQSLTPGACYYLVPMTC